MEKKKVDPSLTSSQLGKDLMSLPLKLGSDREKLPRIIFHQLLCAFFLRKSEELRHPGRPREISCSTWSLVFHDWRWRTYYSRGEENLSFLSGSDKIMAVLSVKP